MSFRQYRELEKGEQLVVACDTGNGGGDFCAAPFISVTKKDVPLVYHSAGIAPDMTDAMAPALDAIADKTNVRPTVTYELNNGGFNELRRLEAMNRQGKFILWRPVLPEGKGYGDMGWTTTELDRKSMLTDLKDCLDNGVLRLYDKELVKELLAFVNIRRPGGGWKPQAESGSHDDLVMALAITWQLALTAQPPSLLVREQSFQRVQRRYDPVTGRMLS